MMQEEITIAKDYTEYPGPRYSKLGDGSGEIFRDKLLLPAMEKYERVIVHLDGTRGYGSSFLEEAFGGAVRQGARISREKLILESKNKALIDKIWNYIDRAMEDAGYA